MKETKLSKAQKVEAATPTTHAMSIKISDAQKQALRHAAKVFFFAGLSAVVPLVVAYLQNDERYALLIPVINGAWMGIRKYYLIMDPIMAEEKK